MIIILFNLKENLGVSQKKKKIFFSFLIDVIEGVLHFHGEVIILFLYFVQTVNKLKCLNFLVKTFPKKTQQNP